jgi:hypothetical protein
MSSLVPAGGAGAVGLVVGFPSMFGACSVALQ